MDVFQSLTASVASRAENEQEELAIAALEQSLRLEPQRREAWLVLATSLTNEVGSGVEAEKDGTCLHALSCRVTSLKACVDP